MAEMVLSGREFLSLTRLEHGCRSWSWYTDPEKTDKWISNPNYPDKDMYKSAVVDYAMNNAQSTSWYYVNGTEEFNATLDSVFSSVWAGEETMEEAINENLEELQDIFAENNG